MQEALQIEYNNETGVINLERCTLNQWRIWSAIGVGTEKGVDPKNEEKLSWEGGREE